MSDIAQLGIQVTETGADKATGKLNVLGGAAARAEAATDSLAASNRGATGAAAAAAKGYGASGVAAASASKQLELMNRAANQNVAAMKGASSSAGYQSKLVAMQLSQVAQQASVTGNWVQALAIQLPDLTLGFGVVGIAVGVVAGALLPLIVNMATTSSGVKGLSSDMARLASEAASLDAVASAISGLESLQKKYAEAIVNSGKAQASATALILANTEKEFNAKKSLLELELKRQQAAIAMQKAELATAGGQLKKTVSSTVFTRDDTEARGFSDPRIGQFVRNPDTEGVLDKTRAVIESSGLADKIIEIRAQLALTEASTSTLEDALKTTFGSGVKNADALFAAYDKASKTAKKVSRDYEEIVDGANRRIEALKAEQAALGMTEQAALKLRYQTDLLNQAQQRGITLTASQRTELSGLAGQMSALETATSKIKEAMAFAKDFTHGFMDDFKSSLQGGATIWQAFGDAALGVLDRIADKLLNEVVDALFEVNKAGTSGGGILNTIFSGIGSLLGGGSSGGATSWASSGSFDTSAMAKYANGTPAARGGLAWVGEGEGEFSIERKPE